jgi:hypothetical protein
VASIEAGTYELTGDVKETNGKGGTVKGFYGSEENVTHIKLQPVCSTKLCN